MQRAAIWLCCATACAVALWSLGVAPGAHAQENPAHALAEKFSRAADDAERAEEARQAEAARKAAAEQEAARKKSAEAARKAQAEAQRRRAEEQRRADEAEMLRQARAEAEARRAAELKAQKERAEAERIAREAEAKRRKEAQARLEAEREAARAQAAQLAREAEERRQEQARRAEEVRKVEAARLAREIEEQRLADERKAAEAQRTKEQAELEAKRQEELRQIAEKFKQARVARERAAREQEERERIAKEQELEETRTSLGGPRPADTYERAPERVSVLLIVEPRHHGKTANPVLCIGKSCYISSGAVDDAERMSRTQVLGPGNTIGRRAGPCNKQTSCIFRNVYLGEVASIQPIDLGFWGHKRHDIYTVRPDKSCDVIKGRLFCATPVIGHGYRAWVVPEAIAAKAGPEALEEALEDGLPPARSAALDGWSGTVRRQDR